MNLILLMVVFNQFATSFGYIFNVGCEYCLYMEVTGHRQHNNKSSELLQPTKSIFFKCWKLLVTNKFGCRSIKVLNQIFLWSSKVNHWLLTTSCDQNSYSPKDLNGDKKRSHQLQTFGDQYIFSHQILSVTRFQQPNMTKLKLVTVGFW